MFGEYSANDEPYLESNYEGGQDFGIQGNNKQTNGFMLNTKEPGRYSPQKGASAYRNHLHSHPYTAGPSRPDYTALSRLGGNGYIYYRGNQSYYLYGSVLFVHYYQKINY